MYNIYLISFRLSLICRCYLRSERRFLDYLYFYHHACYHYSRAVDIDKANPVLQLLLIIIQQQVEL